MRKAKTLLPVLLALFSSNHCVLQAAVAGIHARVPARESAPPCHKASPEPSSDDHDPAPEDCGGVLCCATLVWAPAETPSLQPPSRPERAPASLDASFSVDEPLSDLTDDRPPPGPVAYGVLSSLPDLRGPPAAGL